MDIYEEIGVRKVINCLGPVTKVGGSLMPIGVIKAMEEAAKSFVSIDELLEKTGEKIAKLTGTPSAFITSGGAAGLAVSAAACMAGNDPQKAKQLPNTSGMKNEIITLHCHRIRYDQAIRVAGACFVETGFADQSTIDDLESHISDKTTAILYIARFEKIVGSIPLMKIIEIAHIKGIPVIVDAADELPPLSNLHRYTDMGANLVIYSGGKGLMGPQGTGLILGDKDLIKACAVNASPNYGIGRSMKVSKEEVIGLTKAVELYVNKDFELEMQAWEKQRQYIIEKLISCSQINCTSYKPVPPGSPGSYYIPSVYIDFNEEKLSLTKDEVIKKLWEGNPRIVVGAEVPTGIVLRMMMLEKGQEDKVVERLLEVFKE